MGLIREVLDYKSKILIVAFSSGIGSFDWLKTIEERVSDLTFQRIYLMDISRSWYHFGFEELGGIGLDPLANFLDSKIKECNAKRIMFVGSSMGGYAAIAFGCILNVDLVLSVVPQISIENIPEEYNINKNDFICRGITLQSIDLRIILDKYQNNKTKYKVFYGINHEHDVWQYNLIKNYKNVFGYEVNCERNHGLVPRILVKNGTIEREIRNFIEEKHDN